MSQASGRVIRVLLGAALAAIVVVGIARLLVWPPQGNVGEADAVAVLAGPPGRLAVASDLIERGVAPVLVLSEVDADYRRARTVQSTCAGTRRVPRHREVEVVCFTPEPEATRGEIRKIAALAEQRGWETLIVVTSTYHVTRTRLLLGQCFDGDYQVLGSGWPPRPYGKIRAAAREALALAAALTVSRAC